MEHGLGGAALGWRQRSSELGEAARSVWQRMGGAGSFSLGFFTHVVFMLLF